jgi:hypothetical protein
MFRKIAKVITINIIIIALLLSFLELIFRELFPEFKNEIFSESVTNGKQFWCTDFMGIKARVPYEGYNIKSANDTPIMLILGDSISWGYGTAYEDIYWRKLERLMNLSADSKIQVISLSDYGNNLSDSVKNLKSLFFKSGKKLPIKYIVYQFNFNDIMPFNQADLKEGTHLKGIEHTDLFKKFMIFRYKYLNRSVVFRVIQHYAGILKMKTRGTCEERGYDALAWYTWTFGAKPFKEQSELLWNKMIISLEELKGLSDMLNAECIIFISPILYDIDTRQVHPYYNKLNIDFSCATINPRKRLKTIADRLKIYFIDPEDYLKEHFDLRVREGNFEPFWFNGDDNHFTPVASQYIAEYIFKCIKTKDINRIKWARQP